MNKFMAFVGVIGFSLVANVEAVATRTAAAKDPKHPVTVANTAKAAAKEAGKVFTEDDMHRAITEEAEVKASYLAQAKAWIAEHKLATAGIAVTGTTLLIVAADLARGKKSVLRNLVKKQAKQELVAAN